MSQVRKLAMFGGTFAVALGIGFVMQNGDALAARFGTEDELRAAQAEVAARTETEHFIVLDALPEDQIVTEKEAAAVEAAADPGAGPVLPDLAQPQTASVLGVIPSEEAQPTLPDLPVQVAAADPDQLPDLTAPMTMTDQTEALDCSATLDADVRDAAMVDLTLTAPCAIDARVTMHHQGVMFTLFTDSDGRAEVTMPALAENAIFIADITGSTGAMAMVQVPDVALYDRAILQWQGAAGLELHALEFGADYGSDGHIWRGMARDMSAAAAGDAGFLVSLGDANAEEALLAEVYTFPTGTSLRDGSVILSAEIEISDLNCGSDVSAQSLQVGPSMENTALDLTLTLPGCDATGDFLVLQNMFEDLTLAAR